MSQKITTSVGTSNAPKYIIMNNSNYAELLGLWTLSIVRCSKEENRRTLRFGNWSCLRPQVKPTQLGPLEGASLNHWTFCRLNF
jgi:hypothetical protein